MGRHSAPDDDRDEAPPAATAYAVTLAPGRHVTGGDAHADDPAAGTTEAQWRPVDAMSDTDVAIPALVSGAETEPLPVGESSTAEIQPSEPVTLTKATTPAKSTKAARAPKPPKARRESGTRADLRLLREQPGLRLRCTLGLVLPFVALAVVLLVGGRLGSFLIWIWIPAIVAGVIVGSLLDLAHRKSRVAAPEKPEKQETADSTL